MSGQLAGQVGLVTGGGRGIGAAIACALADEGMAVAVMSRSEAQLAATVAAIEQSGGHAIAVAGDVAQARDVDRVIHHVVGELGPVDLLVNNAGRGPERFGPFWEADMDDWWKVLAVNLLGPALASRAVLPDMTGVRAWADEVPSNPTAELKKRFPSRGSDRFPVLAIAQKMPTAPFS